MATYSKIDLSASTDGRGIAVAATATAGTLIHTGSSTATTYDEIWLYATNTHSADEVIVVEFGASGSGPADGAIDKKNVLSVLLPNADNITKEKYGKSKTILEALDFLVKSKKYKGLQTWVNKGSYKFLKISNLDKKADDKDIRRGLLNLNYAI